jgi:hypothetical protein
MDALFMQHAALQCHQLFADPQDAPPLLVQADVTMEIGLEKSLKIAGELGPAFVSGDAFSGEDWRELYWQELDRSRVCLSALN